jgi:tyrosine decarboxylase
LGFFRLFYFPRARHPSLQATIQADVDAGLVYKDWSITLTRRFRALKMWLVLRCYGVDGLRDHIRSDVRMAEAFETMVKADPRFEVVTDRKFALVCFRLRPPPHKFGGDKTANDLNRALLDEINAVRSGPYMSSAMVGGMYILRCAVGSKLTQDRHVKDAWEVVQDRASSLLLKMETIYSLRH